MLANLQTRAILATLIAVGALALTLSNSGAVYAHGFGEGVALPVPIEQYYAAAAAAVLLSFVLVGLFIGRSGRGNPTYPRFDLLTSSLRDILISPITRGTFQAIVLLLLLITLISGLNGKNLLSTVMIWIFFSVGMVYLSAFVGNIWMAVNPWKTIFECFESRYGDSMPEPRPWPAGYGVWPALALFIFYRWIETALPERNDPRALAALILGYSLITFGGMWYFGKHPWLRFGDPFSVFFRLLSKFSPTELRLKDAALCADCDSMCEGPEDECVDCYECYEWAPEDKRELNLRPLGAGLTLVEQAGPGEVPFVLFMLSSLAFDGFGLTRYWRDIADSLGVATQGEFSAFDSMGLFGSFGLFLLAYAAFSYAMKLLAGSRDATAALALKFVYSLLPIAIAYEVAHFITLLLVDGQLIIPLASDPFGFGWDLFGTAGFPINFGFVNTAALWNTQVALVVIAHIIAVYLAHLVAIRLFERRRQVLLSQLPMIGLMVGYTVFSLWLLSASIATTE